MSLKKSFRFRLTVTLIDSNAVLIVVFSILSRYGRSSIIETKAILVLSQAFTFPLACELRQSIKQSSYGLLPFPLLNYPFICILHFCSHSIIQSFQFIIILKLRLFERTNSGHSLILMLIMRNFGSPLLFPISFWHFHKIHILHTHTHTHTHVYAISLSY